MNALSLLVFLSALSLGCGGDAPPPQEEPPQLAEEGSGPSRPAEVAETPKAPDVESSEVLTPDGEGVVRVEANDLMRFNASRIEVEGTAVKLELKHVGTLAKTGMGHNLVVLNSGVDEVAWANAAATARDSEYVPEGDERVVAHTRLLGGGESDVIAFEVPGPGEYPFVCSFPGHAMLMRGVLVVR